jgi:phage terminase large subunit-like protein
MVEFNAYRSLGPLYSELVGFGTEAHDDCVDAIGYALSPLRKNTALDIG